MVGINNHRDGIVSFRNQVMLRYIKYALMMRPPRGMLGTTFCMRKIGPYTLVPMIVSILSFVSSSSDLGEPAVALFTSTNYLRQPIE